MAIINEPERSKFYQKVRHLLGAPLRSVELEDEINEERSVPEHICKKCGYKE